LYLTFSGPRNVLSYKLIWVICNLMRT